MFLTLYLRWREPIIGAIRIFGGLGVFRRRRQRVRHRVVVDRGGLHNRVGVALNHRGRGGLCFWRCAWLWRLRLRRRFRSTHSFRHRGGISLIGTRCPAGFTSFAFRSATITLCTGCEITCFFQQRAGTRSIARSSCRIHLFQGARKLHEGIIRRAKQALVHAV